MTKKYYSIPQVANILHESRMNVYKKVKAGKIKAIRIGKNYAIPENSLKYLVGKALKESTKEVINDAINRAVKQYGETLRKLGNED